MAGGRTLVVGGVVLAMVGVIGAAASMQRPASDDGPSPLAARFEERRLRAAGTPEARLAELQQRARADGNDWRAWAGLGLAYLDQARRSGDSRLYPKAERSLDRSLEIRPEGNVTALVGHSALAAARHDFEQALVWADRASAVSADDPDVLGALGDAQIELGRYDEGFETFQRMVDRRPDLASYARVAYARELQGDVPGAIAAFDAARRAASTAADDAFATFQLAELHWNSGNADRAAELYGRAQQLDPGLVAAPAALARVAYWQGRPADAAAALEAVVERLPLPQFLAELGDIYAVSGRPDAAAEQYELVELQRRLGTGNGVVADVDAALFSADHGLALDRGLADAQAQYARRPGNVFVADALAWQLHKHGRHGEALAHADEALRLGTRRAAFHYHRATIRQALGMADSARADLEAARAINPHFSILHGPVAPPAP